MCTFPALLTPLPVIPFTTEEITGCTDETAIGANKVGQNPPSCFFISSFTVSITPSINTFESYSDFMLLIISFISSSEINKVNLSPALTAFPPIFLPNLFIAFEVLMLTNSGKLFLTKEIATFVNVFS